MNVSLIAIKSQFKDLGIKSTIPRVVIYQSLMKFEYHPSAEEIHLGIQKKYSGVSLATVYKTLDMLVQNGLAYKVVTDEDKVRYDARTDQHIHLYCKKTKKIVDYEDPDLEQIVLDYLTKKGIPGFNFEQIQINIKGEITTKNK
jgi:Fur family peroxide stress response transcriptional regulator